MLRKMFMGLILASRIWCDPAVASVDVSLLEGDLQREALQGGVSWVYQRLINDPHYLERIGVVPFELNRFQEEAVNPYYHRLKALQDMNLEVWDTIEIPAYLPYLQHAHHAANDVAHLVSQLKQDLEIAYPAQEVGSFLAFLSQEIQAPGIDAPIDIPNEAWNFILNAARLAAVMRFDELFIAAPFEPDLHDDLNSVGSD